MCLRGTFESRLEERASNGPRGEKVRSEVKKRGWGLVLCVFVGGYIGFVVFLVAVVPCASDQGEKEEEETVWVWLGIEVEEEEEWNKGRAQKGQQEIHIQAYKKRGGG